MLSHVADFVAYMLFSSLEYCGLFLLIFTSFTLRPEYYKKEITLLTISFALFSYILVITNLYKIIPIPLFLVIILTFLFKKLFSVKYAYSLLISVSGLVFYGLLQASLINIAIYFDVITMQDTTYAFGTTAYLFQFLCAIISVTVALRVRHYHRGFGFSLNKFSNNRFVIVSILSLILTSIIYHVSLHNQTSKVFFVSVVIFIASTISIIFLSKQQDNKEFTL